MGNNYSWDLDCDYIAHYGTKRHSGRYPWGSGAKWGKTPLGRGIEKVKGFFKKKEPVTSNVETSEAKREVNTSGKSEITADEFNSKHKDILENNFQKYKLDSDYQDRMNKAADLGLRALAKISYDDIDPNNDADKQWFLFEDQTVGLPQIADMALRGKSKEEIESVINDAQKVNREGRYTSKVGPLADSGNPSKFIDEVIKIRDSGAVESRREDSQNQPDPEKHEADRKAALESGDRNEIAKYFNESSYSELQQALNKANLKDMMNKSLEEAYKSSQPKDTTKDDWNDYVQQELWSGDLNRIMKVASDKSVNQNDLNNAISKATTLKSTNAKLNPSNAEKFGSAVDKVTTGLNKAVNLYESGAQSWNTVAGLYNTFNKSGDKLTMLPTNIKNFNLKDAQEAKSKEWEKYVKQELWSGDLNRIMRVANDKSVNNKDLDNAIAKANKIDKILHPDKNDETDKNESKKKKK